MSKFNKQFNNFFKTFLRRIDKYLIYVVLLVVLLGGIWFYFFVEKYFISFKEDFALMKASISDISYTTLNENRFNEVYKKYKIRETVKDAVPSDIVPPF